MLEFKRTAAYFIFLAIFVWSCEKKENPEIKSWDNHYVVAGNTDGDNLHYVNFLPSLIIKGVKIGTDSDYTCKDSLKLDINNDSKFDIQFRYNSEFHQPSYICEGIDCCMPWGFSECSVKPSAEIEIASSDKFGLRPEAFAKGDTVNSKLNWIKYSNQIIFATWGLNNNWVKNGQNYMAFRLLTKTDTLYGWFQLNTYSANKIEILDYAIEEKY